MTVVSNIAILCMARVISVAKYVYSGYIRCVKNVNECREARIRKHLLLLVNSYNSKALEKYLISTVVPVKILNYVNEKAMKIRFSEGVRLLLLYGANNEQHILEGGCALNLYDIVEFALKAGANPKKALQYTTSDNIRKLLYRYIQHTENIN